jgi:hypothetical protein
MPAPPPWEGRRQWKSRAGSPTSLKRQLQNRGHRFTAASQKDTDMGLEVGIGDALGTHYFVLKEQLAPQRSTNNQGGDENGFK